MNLRLPSMMLPVLVAFACLALPARVAVAGIASPQWDLPSFAEHHDPNGPSRPKIPLPSLTTAHTNQPPAPPDSPLVDPGQGEQRRGDGLPPAAGVLPSLPPLPLMPPNGFDTMEPGDGFGATGISLAPTRPIDEGLVSRWGTSDVSSGAPSVVPGPAAIGLLLGAGFAAGRRRRRA